MPDEKPTPEAIRAAMDSMGSVVVESEILEATPPIDLWRALLVAQKAVKAVSKDSTAEVKKNGNTLYTYAFASTEDMMHEARQALLEAGLVPQRLGYEVRRTPATVGLKDRNGNESTLIEVVSCFRLIHPESGQWEDYPPVAMPIVSHNGPDKALAGALTYGWSYWLRDVLCIPRKDDTSPDRREIEPQSGYTGSRGQQQRGGGRRQDESPREGFRRVVKSGDGNGEQQGGQREGQQARQPQSDPPRKPGSRNPDDPEVEAAHKRLVVAAKSYQAACKAAGTQSKLYDIAGAAAHGEGHRWNHRDDHSAAEYDAAVKALEQAVLDMDGAADDVPAICAACGAKDGQPHADGCPEAPRGDADGEKTNAAAGETEEPQREPGDDDPDAVGSAS